jgi:lipopolysaccharide transport system ATP-binding protein
MKPVIKIQNLGKQYRLGSAGSAHYATIRESIMGSLRAPLNLLKRGRASRNGFWALENVNLEIGAGEVVGVIGRNGAGKSTLLKIISRVAEPTTGRVELYGRVGSLLEVGTGFHAELTGRENIYLSAAILGMKKSEIDRKFDEIVAFAEIEKFLDTPVKRYSSGMYVRLAFSVAAHLEPEILMIDEVLAVGDMAFQQKCLEKMRDVTKEGHTVLLVSHNMATVSSLCQKSIWLDEGKVRFFGSSGEAIQGYLSDQQSLTGVYLRGEGVHHSPPVLIKAARLRSNEGTIASLIDARAGFSVEIEYEVLKRTLAWVGFVISTASGFDVLSASDGDVDKYAVVMREPGTYTSVCMIPGGLFNYGRYFLSLHAARSASDIFDSLEHVLAFDLENSSGVGSYMPRDRRGVISPKLNWELRPLVTQ